MYACVTVSVCVCKSYDVGLCLVCMCLSKQMGYAMAEGGFRLFGNGSACVRVFGCGVWGAGVIEWEWEGECERCV